MWLIRFGIVVGCLGMLGCGGVAHHEDAGSNPADASVSSDAPPAVDAGAPDATVQAAAPPSKQIVSGSGHASGSTYSIDMQFGNAFSQAPSTGNGKTVQGASPIKP